MAAGPVKLPKLALLIKRRKTAVVALASVVALVVWWAVRIPPLSSREKQLVGAWNQSAHWSSEIAQLNASESNLLNDEQRERREILIDNLSRTRSIDLAIVLKDDRSVDFLRSFDSLRFGGQGQRGYWRADGNDVVIQAWSIAAFPYLNRKGESRFTRWRREVRNRISPSPPKPTSEVFEIRMAVRSVHDGLVMYHADEDADATRFIYQFGVRSPEALPLDEGFVAIESHDDSAFFINVTQPRAPKPDRATPADWPRWQP